MTEIKTRFSDPVPMTQFYIMAKLFGFTDMMVHGLSDDLETRGVISKDYENGTFIIDMDRFDAINSHG